MGVIEFIHCARKILKLLIVTIFYKVNSFLIVFGKCGFSPLPIFDANLALFRINQSPFAPNSHFKNVDFTREKIRNMNMKSRTCIHVQVLKL